MIRLTRQGSFDPDDDAFKKAIQAALDAEMMSIKGEAMRNLSDKTLNVRTGRLRNSINVSVQQSGKKTFGIIAAGGSGVTYARIHEQGGVVTPVRRKWLTIPTEFAKTGVGAVRGNARSFKDTFFLPKGKGRKSPLIMQKRGNKVVPIFVLKKEVKIPKRPYLRPAVDSRISSIKARIKKEVKKRI